MIESDYRFAAHAANVPDGGSLVAVVEGTSILLCRNGGEIHAIENRCSHTGQPLENGIVRHGWVMCPFHGARFELASGEPLRGPATCPIATFPARIREGRVEVTISAP